MSEFPSLEMQAFVGNSREIRTFKSPGDSVYGMFKRRRKADGKFGVETLLDFDEPGGGFSIRESADLRRKLEMVRAGEWIRITFDSSKELGNGKLMKIFTIENSGFSGEDAGKT